MELRHLRYFVTVAEELHFGRAAAAPAPVAAAAVDADQGARVGARRATARAQPAQVSSSRQRARCSCARRARSWRGSSRRRRAAQRAGRGEVGELTDRLRQHRRLQRAAADAVRVPLAQSGGPPEPARSDHRRAAAASSLDAAHRRGLRAPAGPGRAPGRTCRCCANRWWQHCPAQHPLARARGPLALARLSDSPFILFPRHMAPGLYDDVVSFCRQAGFSPRVEQEAVQMQTIVSLVSAGLGRGPDSRLDAQPRAHRRGLPQPARDRARRRRSRWPGARGETAPALCGSWNAVRLVVDSRCLPCAASVTWRDVRARADAGRRARCAPGEAATLELGARLASVAAQPGLMIYLSGELGAGKTTLVRGCLRALGYRGRVKSPTFTLVELYRLSRLDLHHFDFYRFNDPREWMDAGFRDVFGGANVCLVEWPEKAGSQLPRPDLRDPPRARGCGAQRAARSGHGSRAGSAWSN